MNARAASEPGVASWIATEMSARASGSTSRSTRIRPVTGRARSQVCGTMLVQAPAPTFAYRVATESVSTCGMTVTPLRVNAASMT